MPELLIVERMRVNEEAAGSATYAQELSASIANFKDVRYRSAEATLTRDMLVDEHVNSTPYAQNLDIVSRRANELSVETDLMPTGTALAEGVTPAYTNHALGIILKAILGGYEADQGDVEAGTSTTTQLDVTTSGARFAAGGAVGALVGGNLEARSIAGIVGQALTPRVAFSAAPTAASAVYNAHTFYLTDDPSTSLQFVIETADRDDIWWLTGDQCTGLSFDLSLTQLARMTLGLSGANYYHDTEVASPISGSPISRATLTDGDPIPFVDSSAIFVTAGAGATAITEIDCSTITVTPAITFEPISTPSGVNGIRRMKLRPAKPILTVEFTIPFEDISYFTQRDARTKKSLFIQVGNTAGGTALIDLPNLQIQNVQRSDSEGLHGLTVTCQALEDEWATDQTTALRRSPFRVHLL